MVESAEQLIKVGGYYSTCLSIIRQCTSHAHILCLSFRSLLSSAAPNDYSSCLNDSLKLQHSQEAYSSFLRTTIIGSDNSCPDVCLFSRMRTNTSFAEIFEMRLCQDKQEYEVTLQMPQTIQLTMSSFDYPFTSFLLEFGSKYLTERWLCKSDSYTFTLNTKKTLIRGAYKSYVQK